MPGSEADDWDPINEGVGTNRYAYAANDPVNKSDANGHVAFVVPVAIALLALVESTKEAHAPGHEDNPEQTDTSETEALANMAVSAATMAPLGTASRTALGQVTAKLALNRASVWSLGPSARGFAIESKFGANLHASFPVIDKWSEGIATSIKSMDISKGYKSLGQLRSKLMADLRALDRFQGAQHYTRTGTRITIKPEAIQQKVLQIAIPKKPSKAQQAVFDQVKDAGKRSGIDVKTNVID